jgi:predicted GIY-YIG superfamily endonuclease
VDDYQNVCYLIHFDEPVGKSHAQHYLGFAKDLRKRIEQHRTDRGAALIRSANARGIGWRVVRVWRNADADAEIALKKMIPKNLCPHCNVSVTRKRQRLEKSPSARGAASPSNPLLPD